jgi:hypothetical protein
MSGAELLNLLHRADVRPVLVDIGSSGAGHAAWDPIASASVGIGFDPDAREPDRAFAERFHRAITVDKAVTTDDITDEVEFYLTAYPYCSSILEPDMEALSDYIFRDLFKVERRVRAGATSLNRVIDELALPAIDWLKVDAQGLDLAVIKSLSAENFARVLAIDIEPGLVNAYKGEALFGALHQHLLDSGFWLSSFAYQAYPRVHPESVDEIAALVNLPEADVRAQLRSSPTAAEARYLRSAAWLDRAHAGKRDYVLLFVFAVIERQNGFAFDVLKSYRTRFGSDAVGDAMSELVRTMFKKVPASAPASGLIAQIRRRIGTLLRALGLRQPRDAPGRA